VIVDDVIIRNFVPLLPKEQQQVQQLHHHYHNDTANNHDNHDHNQQKEQQQYQFSVAEEYTADYNTDINNIFNFDPNGLEALLYTYNLDNSTGSGSVGGINGLVDSPLSKPRLSSSLPLPSASSSSVLLNKENENIELTYNNTGDNLLNLLRKKIESEAPHMLPLLRSLDDALESKRVQEIEKKSQSLGKQLNSGSSDGNNNNNNMKNDKNNDKSKDSSSNSNSSRSKVLLKNRRTLQMR